MDCDHGCEEVLATVPSAWVFLVYVHVLDTLQYHVFAQIAYLEARNVPMLNMAQCFILDIWYLDYMLWSGSYPRSCFLFGY